MPPGKGMRRVCTVETDLKGGWRGEAKGSTRAVAKGDNKAEVVKPTIEVAKKQPKTQVRIKGGMAEHRMSASTLGAAPLRELRARPIYGNRIKVSLRAAAVDPLGGRLRSLASHGECHRDRKIVLSSVR
jgi:hypothetical protein